MKNSNLYLVEFGDPDITTSWVSSKYPPAYVVAKNYNEAASKGSLWLEYKLSENKKGGILDADGSIDRSKIEYEIPTVKSVKLVCTEVVW